MGMCGTRPIIAEVAIRGRGRHTDRRTPHWRGPTEVRAESSSDSIADTRQYDFKMPFTAERSLDVLHFGRDPKGDHDGPSVRAESDSLTAAFLRRRHALPASSSPLRMAASTRGSSPPLKDA
jgi:hypothetical protein